MRQFPFVVALVALGVAAFAFLTARDAARAAREADLAGLDARLVALEASVLGSLAPPERPGALAVGTTERPAPTEAPSAASGSALAGQAPPLGARELARRLEALERRLAEAGPAGSVEVASKGEIAGSTDAVVSTATPWVSSLDDAEQRFGLSSGQRADLERTIADAKREIDALRKVPDETGTTWEAVERAMLRMENGAVHYDASKLSAFREQVVPGRNESFGAAMRRVRTEAARRMRDALSPSQREAWDQANTKSLVPGTDDPGGFGFIAYSAGSFVPVEEGGASK